MHFEVRQIYSATRHIFNSLLGVKRCGQKASLVFDMLLAERSQVKLLVTALSEMTLSLFKDRNNTVCLPPPLRCEKV